MVTMLSNECHKEACIRCSGSVEEGHLSWERILRKALGGADAQDES